MSLIFRRIPRRYAVYKSSRWRVIRWLRTRGFLLLPPPLTSQAVTAEAFGVDLGPALDWAQFVDEFAKCQTYVLATTGPDLSPHAMPVLAVWCDGAPHLAASPKSRKARNLAINPACCLVAIGDAVDLAVKGDAAQQGADRTCQAVADVYAAKYGWAPAVRNGELWADGAPSAGQPPYAVYRIEPRSAFALPKRGDRSPTRFRIEHRP